MENMCVCILVSGACGCAAPSAERFMLIAESGRVHLHGGVVTRDVRLSFIQQAKPSLQYGQSAIMAKVYGSSLFDMAVCTKSIRLL